ncbi:hypothetical protein GUJ93_ZPchr0007g4067 [Zizania palustris]|uniref:Uncharacterized protein n=1 Tax=Zizania palustris TaxID=103762 RepID=A0A8J5TAK2_ZIZPA|nr:hypothetical protein GUJ93_ZPchr0007g4067 [Zizania palustris]
MLKSVPRLTRSYAPLPLVLSTFLAENEHWCSLLAFRAATKSCSLAQYTTPPSSRRRGGGEAEKAGHVSGSDIMRTVQRHES